MGENFKAGRSLEVLTRILIFFMVTVVTETKVS
jgi:hypothetical protein